MFDHMFEWCATRHLTRVVIMQEEKRQINGKPICMDIRNFFVNPQNEELQSLIRELRTSSGMEIVTAIRKWVRNNIAYTPERGDFWQLPFETLTRRKGDCDDIAILTANLILAAGAKYYDVMLHVVELPNGFHILTTYKGEVIDPLMPSLKWIPTNWIIHFSWNARNAYTKKENMKE